MKKKLSCVLLIDDDAPTNFLNRLVLEESCCTERIHVAQSGQAALDYLRVTSELGAKDSSLAAPELIFLDINMPAMDGWEFLSRYNTLLDAQKPGVVIVMLTTSLNPEDEVKARTIPSVAGFQCKPLTPKVLDNLLGNHFPDYF